MSLKKVVAALGNPLPHQKVVVKADATVLVGKVVYKKIWSSRSRAHLVAKLLVTKEGLVPTTSLRQGDAYDGKFRVRQVLVLDIVDKTGKQSKSGRSDSYGTNGKFLHYTVGKLVNPDGFTTHLWEDCGQGIHCFATIEKAYNL